MDLWLISSNNKTHIRPTSVHGILWLQTHFEESEWEAISSQAIVLSRTDADLLTEDALEAGLIINSVQSAISLSKI